MFQVLIVVHSLQLDPNIIQPFLGDCRDTIAKLDNQNMKSIKGLEDRLYALDQMIASCKKLVNEQKELAQVAGQQQLLLTVSVVRALSVSSFLPAGIFGQSEAS